MSGECVISSVLFLCSKDLKWWNSVTAQSFIRQRKVHPRGAKAGRLRQEKPQSFLASSFFLSPPQGLACANWASQEGGVFVLPEVLTLVCRFSFVPFSSAFPFLCLLATTILDSFFSYSNFLTMTLTLLLLLLSHFSHVQLCTTP